MSAIDGWHEAILMLRKRTGLKQGEAAAMAGLSSAQLSRYESGSASPSLQTLGRLLDAYHTDLAEFGAEARKQAGSNGQTYFVFFDPVPDRVQKENGLSAIRVIREDGSVVPLNAETGLPVYLWYLEERAREASHRFRVKREHRAPGEVVTPTCAEGAATGDFPAPAQQCQPDPLCPWAPPIMPTGAEAAATIGEPQPGPWGAKEESTSSMRGRAGLRHGRVMLHVDKHGKLGLTRKICPPEEQERLRPPVWGECPPEWFCTEDGEEEQ